MLTDSYVEQAFKAKPDITYYFKIFVSIFLIVFGIAFFLIGIPIGLLFVLGGICLFYYFAGDSKMEYEYTLTNEKVEVAAIYNASRRKEKMQFGLDQVTMIVPKDSQRISQENFTKKYNFTSGMENNPVIALVLDFKGKKQLILMEPNEKTMEHIKKHAKDKIYDL